MEMSFTSIIAFLAGKLNDEELQLATIVARLIWLRRNNMVFGGKFMSLVQILETAISQMESFNKAEKGRRMTSHKRPAQTTIWRKPCLGWIKLNWDATIDVKQQKMVIGIIARDHAGAVLVAVSASRPHVTDPTIAKAIAAWKMVDVCISLGFPKVLLEGDSLEVVNSLQSDGCCWSRYGTTINDTKVLLNSLQEWQICHIKRAANVVAHLLAKHGLTVEEDCISKTNFPIFLLDIVSVDQGSSC
jgi:hypothetical protein